MGGNLVKNVNFLKSSCIQEIRVSLSKINKIDLPAVYYDGKNVHLDKKVINKYVNRDTVRVCKSQKGCYELLSGIYRFNYEESFHPECKLCAELWTCPYIYIYSLKTFFFMKSIKKCNSRMKQSLLKEIIRKNQKVSNYSLCNLFNVTTRTIIRWKENISNESTIKNPYFEPECGVC